MICGLQQEIIDTIQQTIAWELMLLQAKYQQKYTENNYT